MPLLSRTGTYIMKTTQRMLYTYLILLCTVIPLYMKEGYYKLGEAKGVLFLILSGVFFVASLVALFVTKTKFGPGILGVLLFSNVVSFLFSDYKETSFLGLSGWRMGFLSALFMIFFAALLSGGIKLSRYLVAVFMIIPFAIAVLGILGRFGIYPLGVYADDGSFISTLGNINWFTGYLSVFVPLGVGVAATRKLFSAEFFLSEVYVITGLIALLLQGSESGLLIILGTYFFLLFICLGERALFKAFLTQLFTLGMAMTIVFLLMLFFGRNYTYDSNILIALCERHLGLILMAAAFFMYRLSRFMEEISFSWKKILYRRSLIILVLAGVAAASVLLLGAFSDDFGNGRGIIWRMSFDMYLSLSPIRKLLGVGQDCYYPYAYSDAFWSESLINVFGGNRLTNAHNIYLTLLIEGGAMGLLSYIFIFGYTLFNLVKEADKKKHAAMICALPIFAYLINGIVSFSTVVSTPYVFMILGYALFVIKEDKSTIKQDQAQQ